MKEEAGGQVGGLEMGMLGRERLARESRGWRCGGCGGRTNEEVLRECERAAETCTGKTREEEVVPEELRLGYRDELGKGRDGGMEGVADVLDKAVDPVSTTTTTTATPGLTPSSSHSSLPATTAAPVVATTTTPLPTIPTSSSSVLFSSPPPARPPTAPIPTRTIQVRPPRAPRRVSTAATATAVPAWVDKAIVGVLVGLVVMVVRKWWGWM